MVGHVAVAVVALFAVLTEATVDRTRSPGARGRIIVEAVVDRIRSNCIFGDDRLFLRRLAYVETSDGEDTKTYRPGYHGGIWQIDESKFNMISCSSYRTRETCARIRSKFKINWNNVVWSDLRKPLYSGLAAALYTKYRGFLINTLSNQAYNWRRYMRSGGSTSQFTTKAGNLPGSECKTELDLAFIIDGSGSVVRSDFRKMLTFIQNVVQNLDINDEEVRVAALEYSTVIGSTITFNNYTSKSSLLNSIARILKGDRGTNTHLAIENATSVLFNTSNGARPNAKRVAILLTDGASNNKTATILAAAAAKAKGITMISVGVGRRINEEEINAVATEPNCTHVYNINSFLEIDSLLYQLKDTSCTAATSLHPTDTGDGKIEITKSIPENDTVTETYVAPSGSGEAGGNSNGGGTSETGTGSETTTGENGDPEQPVVKSEVQCGSLEIYASYDTPRPGPAFYDVKDSAREGRPSIIYINATVQGRPLYITVVGSPLTGSVTSCLNPSYKVSLTSVPIQTQVVCRVGETERECTVKDFRGSQYSDLLCEDNWNNVINPCTSGHVSIHKHPSDLTKFIRCDMSGKMYITQCPSNETFNENTETCGSEVLGGSGEPLPANIASHCTAENLAAHRFYFAYPGDKFKYIQCDVWGRAWVKSCPDNLEWNDAHSTCSHAHPTPTNPCLNKNGDLLAHSEPGKFIQCVHGKAMVSSCPAGLVFNQQISACDHPSG